MKLRLHYFAWVREAIGKNEECRDLGGVATVGDVLAALERLGPAYADAFAEPARLRFALDQAMVGIDAPVSEGAELAIFPPVTGG